MRPEVARRLLAVLPDFGGKAVVLKGVRRSGKSTLQRQLMQRQQTVLYCNLEDTRLFGMWPMTERMPSHSLPTAVWRLASAAQITLELSRTTITDRRCRAGR